MYEKYFRSMWEYVLYVFFHKILFNFFCAKVLQKSFHVYVLTWLCLLAQVRESNNSYRTSKLGLLKQLTAAQVPTQLY